MTQERRNVAVLFAEVAVPEPELDAALRRMRAAVEREGGTLDKFVGASLMAVFGAPAARGDDASRAVRAALAMKDEPGFRAGINWGEILWGAIGGDRPTAMGDVVNVAQRLMREADEGEVLVSVAARRLAGDAARFGSERRVQLKGRQESVAAHAAREAGRGETEFGAAPGAIVGRAAELERILAAFRAGGAAVLFVTGEAGQGKSRLLHEARLSARREQPGAWVAFGRANESLRLPLGMFAEVMRAEPGLGDSRDERAVVDALDAALRGRVADPRLSAELLALSVGRPLPDSAARLLDAAAASDLTEQAWTAWIRARAAGRPALVCLEDTHWADEASFRLLRRLAADLAGSTVTILASARPAAGLDLAGLQALPLPPLDESGAADVASAVLGAPVSRELAAFLAETAGGNPLYLEELARHLRRLQLVEGSPARLRSSPSGIPETLHGVLVAGLDALDASTRETLKVASVAGRTFERGLLEEAASLDAGPALGRALASGQIVRRGGAPEEYAFRHALLRDAAYSLLPKKLRVRHHAALADVYERHAPARGRRLRALAASHREASGELPAASVLWHKAAAEAARGVNFAEAVEWIHHSQRCGGGPTADAGAGQIYTEMARFEEAAVAIDRVLANPAATPGDRSRAMVSRARERHARGDFEGAIAVATSALGLEAPPEILIQALHIRAFARSKNSQIAPALEDIAAARALCRSHPVAGVTGPQEGGLRMLEGVILYMTGRFEESLEAYRECAVLQAGDPRVALRARMNTALALASLGRKAESAVELEAVVAGFRESGNRMQLAMGLSNLGLVCVELDRYERALECLFEAMALSREQRDDDGVGQAMVTLAAIREKQRDFHACIQGAREAAALLRKCGNTRSVGYALLLEGKALHALSERSAAEKALEEALAAADQCGDRSLAGTIRSLQKERAVEPATPPPHPPGRA